MNNQRKPYTIGLDIGTNSVGYAVVVDDYKVPSKKMKVLGNTDKKYVKRNLIGASLFDEGQTAESRRGKRTSRRRISRRRNRINYLQDFFIEEMIKVDENFFHRLQESFFTMEDKKFQRHPIFGNENEEVEYHKEYPTIYHLRKALADESKKFDIRLVYLALSHIIKYRGHFLIEEEIDANNIDSKKYFEELVYSYNQISNDTIEGFSIDEIQEILESKQSKTAKWENLLKMLKIPKKHLLADFLKLSIGNKVDFKNTFSLDENYKISINDEDYEERRDHLISLVGDIYYDIFENIKKLYDSIQLSNILTGDSDSTNALLSSSMIERYQEHQKDLKALKTFIRENFSSEVYKEMFNDKSKKGYAGYISGIHKITDNHYVSTNKPVSQEEFYNYTKRLLEDIEGSEYFIDKINREVFLRKQRAFDNGSIPNQVHLAEFEAILDNQSKYYSILEENRDKLISLLTFRIPYYVGPLAREKGQSQFSWAEISTAKEPVRPWNFEELVDTEKSAEKFIERMTLRDVYLPENKVLPKNSLLYQQFTIFNELTKVYYEDGKRRVYFDTEFKREMFDNLFKQNKRVTKKKLIEYLDKEHPYLNITGDMLKGIETKFNSSYSTYIDLKSILSEKFVDENLDLIEDIIHTLTIFEDKKLIKKRLKQILIKEEFDDSIINKLSKKQYTGWGRLSRKLIDGIKDKKSNKTILDFLKDDLHHRNFMQLINDEQLTFKDTISNSQIIGEEDIKEVILNLPGSPAIKKGILQSVKIVDELVKVMGYNPENIVIEMARENQTTKRGRDNSKERLEKIQNGLSQFYDSVLNEYSIENTKDLQNEKLYLYYLQNGKDMYTGDDLDISKLSYYDVDHIIPRSFVKDNSFDNKVLVSSKENRGKSDDVPSKAVVNKMSGFWYKLLSSHLISQKKFDNLTRINRGGLTEEMKHQFIERQIVETRQITKYVAQILHNRFNNEEETTRVLTLKSSLVSTFRKRFNLFKVREINDYHHAHDAYLNAVVGTTILRVYPSVENELVYGQFTNSNRAKAQSNKATNKKYFYQNIMKFFDSSEPIVNEDGEVLWNQSVAIPQIKKVLSYRQVNIVKKKEVQTGEYTKESVLSKGESDKLIKRKNNWDTSKYGGYIEQKMAYTVFVVAKKVNRNKLKITREFIGIPIMDKKLFEENQVQYIENRGFVDVDPNKIIVLPKYSLFEFSDGRRRLLASYQELQKGNEIVLSSKSIEFLYHAQKIGRKSEPEHLEFLLNNEKSIDEVLSEVTVFAEKYLQVGTNLEKINKAKDKFEEFTIEEKAESMINLLNLTKYGAPMDFNFLGTKIPRKRYTTLTECSKSTLIHQSVTGLFETRIDLGKL